MLVVTAGVQSSASTWVTNVAADLLSLRGRPVRRTFADTLADVVCRAGVRDLVAKSHHPRRDLCLLAATGAAKVIVSVRAPRDSAASIIQRFGRSARQAIADVTSSLAYLDALPADGPLVLRYEDRFFDREDTVGLIADHLELDVAPGRRREIARRYEADSVLKLISTIPSLPGEQTLRRADSIEHVATGFHTRHITDRRSNKFGEHLSASEAAFCEAVASHAMARYGYRSQATVLPAAMFACTALARPLEVELRIKPGNGCAIYGPYIHLPAGDWRVRLLTSRACAADVYDGSAVLAAGDSSLPISFRVDDPVSATEFRMHATDTENLFFGAELTRLSS